MQTKNLLLGEKGNLLLSFFYGNQFNAIESCEDCKIINPSAIQNHFVAPERPLTFKSDWWSYGVILYEILVGMVNIHHYSILFSVKINGLLIYRLLLQPFYVICANFHRLLNLLILVQSICTAVFSILNRLIYQQLLVISSTIFYS